jgi:hypothetical protein
LAEGKNLGGIPRCRLPGEQEPTTFGRADCSTNPYDGSRDRPPCRVTVWHSTGQDWTSAAGGGRFLGAFRVRTRASPGRCQRSRPSSSISRQMSCRSTSSASLAARSSCGHRGVPRPLGCRATPNSSPTARNQEPRDPNLSNVCRMMAPGSRRTFTTDC